MLGIFGAEHLRGSFSHVPFIDFFYGQDSQQFVLGVAERNVLIEAQLTTCINGKSQGYGKEMTALQTHLFQNASEIFFADKSVKWRECAAGEQFEVTGISFRNLDRREMTRVPKQFVFGFTPNGQVYQFIAIWRNEFSLILSLQSNFRRVL